MHLSCKGREGPVLVKIRDQNGTSGEAEIQLVLEMIMGRNMAQSKILILWFIVMGTIIFSGAPWSLNTPPTCDLLQNQSPVY